MDEGVFGLAEWYLLKCLGLPGHYNEASPFPLCEHVGMCGHVHTGTPAHTANPQKSDMAAVIPNVLRSRGTLRITSVISWAKSF